MKRYPYIFLVGFTLFLAFVGGVVPCSARISKVPIPASLKRILAKNEISQATIARCLAAGKTAVNLNLILKNLQHRERREDYRSFLTKASIDSSRRFFRRNRSLLRKIERHYRVPGEIIVAILRVESDFGRHQEQYGVLEVYTSLAALVDPKVRDKVRHRGSGKGFPLSGREMRRRIQNKASWGVRELTCLLRAEQKGTLDVLTLKGSWAGAFGMPQFIPTSFERYGVDWDHNGKIQLDRLPDAAASIANYLKMNGWRSSMDSYRKLAVIKTYNHSQPYAETILRISQELRSRGTIK